MRCSKKAFTFVELLLVMLVLGIIISLTLPILKNIKNDDDIFRAYMKKANQDVTDAINMIFIKNPRFRGFSSFEMDPLPAVVSQYNPTPDQRGTYPGLVQSIILRNMFNSGLGVLECYALSVAAKGKDNCLSNFDFGGDNAADMPGLLVGNKFVMIFNYDHEDATDDTNKEETYGRIYIDVNQDKSPNKLCKDRYVFRIYNDRVAMEGCDYSI